MVKQIALSDNGSYQLAFLKEVVLNHLTKGEINVSFRRAPCSLPSISKKSAKLKCLKQKLRIKFISKTCSKYLFSTTILMEQWLAQFIE